MIEMLNTKFDVSAIICFWVMLITDTQITDIQTHTHIETHTHTHTHRPFAKNVIFGFRGPQNHVNPSKSPFRKYDPKTILSLLISKRK